MKRSLLLTNDFPPVISGISTVFYHVWKYFPSDRMLVLTPRVKDSVAFDRNASFKPLRFRPNREGILGKIGSMCGMFLWTAYLVIFRNVREIHAGQVLTSGPIGYFFQAVFGIPCFLWIYGGETTSSYSASALKMWIVTRMVRKSAFIVTNSPSTTREMTGFGISRDRIIEILPAVDSVLFTPGSPDEHLIEKYRLEGKDVLVTVSRLAKRKGHDLVLRALAVLRERKNLHYLIVGAGEDRARLEQVVRELGIEKMVTFAGRAEDSELPLYYRLGDVYVMPNREVFDEPDSVEGFGISFIEAGACGKAVIAGRSGGAGDAVENGITGYLIDPENPAECAEKIEYLLDHPEVREEMGRRGRERVEKQFTWRHRAETLSGYLTVPPIEIRK
ncbi:glycosyltransferase family 4 protein [bacterium]|nr:glycosyltransferase family 4 protein [bacterium]